MTPEEAIRAVHSGLPVQCTPAEYPEIRKALQEQAGKWIDGEDHIRAQIALSEVKRLDHVHEFQLFPLKEITSADIRRETPVEDFLDFYDCREEDFLDFYDCREDDVYGSGGRKMGGEG